jgi:hypothetical protein
MSLYRRLKTLVLNWNHLVPCEHLKGKERCVSVAVRLLVDIAAKEQIATKILKCKIIDNIKEWEKQQNN